MKIFRLFLALCLFVLLVFPASVWAADASTDKVDEDAKIAEAMLNPLSYLWLAFIQNDTTWFDGDILDRLGEDSKVQNTTLVMPVLSFQLTEK